MRLVLLGAALVLAPRAAQGECNPQCTACEVLSGKPTCEILLCQFAGICDCEIYCWPPPPTHQFTATYDTTGGGGGWTAADWSVDCYCASSSSYCADNTSFACPAPGRVYDGCGCLARAGEGFATSAIVGNTSSCAIVRAPTPFGVGTCGSAVCLHPARVVTHVCLHVRHCAAEPTHRCRWRGG
jgi:hypothetical protein